MCRICGTHYKTCSGLEQHNCHGLPKNVDHNYYYCHYSQFFVYNVQQNVFSSGMQYQDGLELHVKYTGYEDLLTLIVVIEYKDNGIKITMNVTDLNHEPVNVVNLTVRILYAEELPLQQNQIER